MAEIDTEKLSTQEREGLCCVYATLALHDGGKEVNEANIEKVIKVSGNKVDTKYVAAFARAVKGLDIKALLNSFATAAPAAAPHEAEEKSDTKKGGKYLVSNAL